MNPNEYLDAIKTAVKEDVKDGILNSEKNINTLAMSAQAKILGFTMDSQYSYITEISDDFATELTEGSKKEIEILRKKIQKSATNKIKNIIDLEIPRLANYAFEREIQRIIVEERDKALPIIRNVVKQVVQKELVEPWELIAKMQNKHVILSDIEDEFDDDTPF